MGRRVRPEDRQRDVHFPRRLFGEPSRDLVLALFIARDNGRAMTLSDAYKAADVIPAAGKELLDVLERDGVIVRLATEGGEQLVELTGDPSKQLSDYLGQLR